MTHTRQSSTPSIINGLVRNSKQLYKAAIILHFIYLFHIDIFCIKELEGKKKSSNKCHKYLL